MKTNFALSLSLEGIRLLHRVKGGWHLTGEAAHDAPDLTSRLAVMRKTALALEPGGMRTKILLPKDLIKYLSLDTTRAGEDQVRAALDGATPYDVDELVWDYSKGGGRTYIAAVARETLLEAEAFALDHKFSPVCFASVPEPFTFVGEVFFGPTESGQQHLGQDDTIMRDDEPVHVIGRSHLPPDSTPVVPPAEAMPLILQQPPLTAPVAPLPDIGVEPPPATTSAATPEPPTRAPDLPEPEPASESGASASEIGMAVFSSRARPSHGQSQPAAIPPAAATPPSAPPLASDEAGQPLFAHRGAAPPPKTRAVTLPQAASESPRTLGAAEPEPVPPLTARPSLSAPSLSGADTSAAPVAPAALRRITPMPVEALPRPEPARRPQAQAESEAEKLTIFGARKASAAQTRGKPRYLGLILMGLLLLALALAAWWATTLPSDTLSRWFGGASESEAAQTTQLAETAAEPTGLADLVLDPEELADLAEVAESAPPVDQTAEAAAPLLDIGPEATVPSPVAMTLAEAERLHALTGVWQRAPVAPRVPGGESTDDLYSAAIDPVTLGSDAVALAPASTLLADMLILPPADPPPPGSSFERDARGFILATAEGTVLPNGVVVFAGRPPVEPVARTVAQATSPSGLDPDSETEAATDAAPDLVADPALAGFRPQARPADVADQIERAALGGLSRDELAGFRPQPRPGDLVVVLPDTAAIAAAVAEASAPPNFDDASSYAVALSPRPGARPRNFDQVVASARASNQQAPAAAAAAASLASAPVPQTVVPSGPVPGGVARAATEENVIALRDVTLIGIFGTSGARIALVRLANGRVVRVGVGDTLDGGQVVSISESALNYVKRGRTITLQMPA